MFFKSYACACVYLHMFTADICGIACYVSRCTIIYTDIHTDGRKSKIHACRGWIHTYMHPVTVIHTYQLLREVTNPQEIKRMSIAQICPQRLHYRHFLHGAHRRVRVCVYVCMCVCVCVCVRARTQVHIYLQSRLHCVIALYVCSKHIHTHTHTHCVLALQESWHSC
jgi:hypothetical protein